MGCPDKKIKNIYCVFEEYEKQEKNLVDYTKIRYHIVWNIKLGKNFRRKTRLVTEDHVTEIDFLLIYFSVVSRDSVRIVLTITVLNDLDIFGCDIQNTYIITPYREKIYTITETEFGSDTGKLIIVTRALYGLRSSSVSFRAKLAQCI